MFASTRKAARRGCAVTALAALSTFPAVPAEAVPFGSPQEIAFSSDAQAGNFEIYATRAAARGILLPDGQVTPMPWVATEPLRLTDHPADDSGPAWSPFDVAAPDGQRLAFESNRDGDFEIYVMSPDGTGRRRLTNTAAMESEPTWFDYSPAGAERIAFSRDIGGNG